MYFRESFRYYILSYLVLFIMIAFIWQLVRFVPAMLNVYSSMLGNLLSPLVEKYFFAATVPSYLVFQLTQHMISHVMLYCDVAMVYQ